MNYISVILPLKIEWEPCYFTSGRDISVGQTVRVEFAGREYEGIVSEIGIAPQTAPSKIKEILEVLDDVPSVSVEEIAFWREIAGYYMCSVGEVCKAAYPALRSVFDKSSLPEKKSKKKVIEERPPRECPVPEIVLSDAQMEAKKLICNAFLNNMPVLLNGVTGSGKTEIYVSLALDYLSEGKNVLYLVPEIALSRQLESRLKKIFADRLLVYHSKETPAKRRNVISAVCGGKPYIVLGTRSAVFLPHNNLGLVIVDEEHDNSYKQDDPAPRYNGRDAAIMLGKNLKSDIILGSATPSLESLYNSRNGKYTEIVLNRRYYNSPDTDIEIIDTIAERRKRGMVGSFSRKLINIINGTLEKGGQVMLLRTRRSYSPVLQCSECGYILKCPHCNVSLSYHKEGEKMQCHYCGYHSAKTDVCPNCGGDIVSLGTGTQKIEEELKELFPEARIARLDSDSAQNKSQEKSIIRNFANGETDILVGTQMVAKGFDFQGLTLVAVLQADTIIGIQDFRADEKAVQVLEQFRGRCGRREEKGLFVIQTSQPEHPVYQNFMTGNRVGGNVKYTDTILSERKEFGYPPFTRIINLYIKDLNESRAGKMAAFLAAELDGFDISGVFEPAVNRISDEYIRVIRINLKKDRLLAEKKTLLLKKIRSFETRQNYSNHIVIDVDPS